MKARPIIVIDGVQQECQPEFCTHIEIKRPGPAGLIAVPVILKGRREGTGCWTWNGDVEKPTLRPSLLSVGSYFLTDGDSTKKFRCHTWITDGKAQFLDDCDHELKGQTIDLIEL